MTNLIWQLWMTNGTDGTVFHGTVIAPLVDLKPDMWSSFMLGFSFVVAGGMLGLAGRWLHRLIGVHSEEGGE